MSSVRSACLGGLELTLQHSAKAFLVLFWVRMMVGESAAAEENIGFWGGVGMEEVFEIKLGRSYQKRDGVHLGTSPE